MKSKITVALLEEALTNNRLTLYYQPVVSLFTGKICGAESLIRWNQPDGSIISPNLFIPLAEKTGFITEITKGMLLKVVDDLEALNLVDDSLFVWWYNENCVKREGVLVSLQVTKPKRKSHDSQSPSYATQPRRSSQSARSITREDEVGGSLHLDCGIRRRVGRLCPSQPI